MLKVGGKVLCKLNYYDESGLTGLLVRLSNKITPFLTFKLFKNRLILRRGNKYYVSDLDYYDGDAYITIGVKFVSTLKDSNIGEDGDVLRRDSDGKLSWGSVDKTYIEMGFDSDGTKKYFYLDEKSVRKDKLKRLNEAQKKANI